MPRLFRHSNQASSSSTNQRATSRGRSAVRRSSRPRTASRPAPRPARSSSRAHPTPRPSPAAPAPRRFNGLASNPVGRTSQRTLRSDIVSDRDRRMNERNNARVGNSARITPQSGRRQPSSSPQTPAGRVRGRPHTSVVRRSRSRSPRDNRSSSRHGSAQQGSGSQGRSSSRAGNSARGASPSSARTGRSSSRHVPVQPSQGRSSSRHGAAQQGSGSQGRSSSRHGLAQPSQGRSVSRHGLAQQGSGGSQAASARTSRSSSRHVPAQPSQGQGGRSSSRHVSAHQGSERDNSRPAQASATIGRSSSRHVPAQPSQGQGGRSSSRHVSAHQGSERDNSRPAQASATTGRSSSRHVPPQPSQGRSASRHGRRATSPSGPLTRTRSRSRHGQQSQASGGRSDSRPAVSSAQTGRSASRHNQAQPSQVQLRRGRSASRPNVQAASSTRRGRPSSRPAPQPARRSRSRSPQESRAGRSSSRAAQPSLRRGRSATRRDNLNPQRSPSSRERRAVSRNGRAVQANNQAARQAQNGNDQRRRSSSRGNRRASPAPRPAVDRSRNVANGGIHQRTRSASRGSGRDPSASDQTSVQARREATPHPNRQAQRAVQAPVRNPGVRRPPRPAFQEPLEDQRPEAPAPPTFNRPAPVPRRAEDEPIDWRAASPLAPAPALDAVWDEEEERAPIQALRAATPHPNREIQRTVQASTPAVRKSGVRRQPRPVQEPLEDQISEAARPSDSNGAEPAPIRAEDEPIDWRAASPEDPEQALEADYYEEEEEDRDPVQAAQIPVEAPGPSTSNGYPFLRNVVNEPTTSDQPPVNFRAYSPLAPAPVLEAGYYGEEERAPILDRMEPAQEGQYYEEGDMSPYQMVQNPGQVPPMALAQLPVQVPVHFPVQALAGALAQLPVQAPVQAPHQFPVQALAGAPIQVPLNNPVQVPFQAWTEAEISEYLRLKALTTLALREPALFPHLALDVPSTSTQPPVEWRAGPAPAPAPVLEEDIVSFQRVPAQAQAPFRNMVPVEMANRPSTSDQPPMYWREASPQAPEQALEVGYYEEQGEEEAADYYEEDDRAPILARMEPAQEEELKVEDEEIQYQLAAQPLFRAPRDASLHSNGEAQGAAGNFHVAPRIPRLVSRLPRGYPRSEAPGPSTSNGYPVPRRAEDVPSTSTQPPAQRARRLPKTIRNHDTIIKGCVRKSVSSVRELTGSPAPKRPADEPCSSGPPAKQPNGSSSEQAQESNSWGSPSTSSYRYSPQPTTSSSQPSTSNGWASYEAAGPSRIQDMPSYSYRASPQPTTSAASQPSTSNGWASYEAAGPSSPPMSYGMPSTSSEQPQESNGWVATTGYEADLAARSPSTSYYRASPQPTTRSASQPPISNGWVSYEAAEPSSPSRIEEMPSTSSEQAQASNGWMPTASYDGPSTSTSQPTTSSNGWAPEGDDVAGPSSPSGSQETPSTSTAPQEALRAVPSTSGTKPPTDSASQPTTPMKTVAETQTDPLKGEEFFETEKEAYEDREPFFYQSQQVLVGVDLEELARERVKIHGPKFKNIVLPANHSRKIFEWTRKQVLEVVAQIFTGSDKLAVDGFHRAEISGQSLKESRDAYLYKMVNLRQSVICRDRFLRFTNMMNKLIEINEAKEVPPKDQGEGLEIEELEIESKMSIETQTCRVQTAVDKICPDESYVEVGEKRRRMRSVSVEKEKLFGIAFKKVPLPFDHDTDPESWDHEQFVEWVTQFLPQPAAHAIDCYGSLDGTTIHLFKSDESGLFMKLNKQYKAISYLEFEEVGRRWDEVLEGKERHEELKAIGRMDYL